MFASTLRTFSNRKLQTGDPDGDLGSNETLLGKEKYVAIVDGAGALVDRAHVDDLTGSWIQTSQRVQL